MGSAVHRASMLCLKAGLTADAIGWSPEFDFYFFYHVSCGCLFDQRLCLCSIATTGQKSHRMTARLCQAAVSHRALWMQLCQDFSTCARAHRMVCGRFGYRSQAHSAQVKMTFDHARRSCLSSNYHRHECLLVQTSYALVARLAPAARCAGVSLQSTFLS